MKLKSPQGKGKRGEYAVRDLLRSYGYRADRTPLSGALDAWPGDITSDFPLFIEVKNTEKTTFLPWYKKAADEGAPRRPIIIWTKNGEDYYAFLKFTDLLDRLQDRPPAPRIPKAQKPKDIALAETAGLKFSKLAQAHRKIK